ncbi:CUEDC2 family protein [Megaselia abdita]
MISAYFNDFASIDSGVVCAWLFKLNGELRQLAAVEEGKDKKTEIQLASLKLSDIIPESKLKRRDSSAQEKEEPVTRNSRRSQHLSETSDPGSTDSSNYDYFMECESLQEIFPNSCYLEIKHCISIAKGDLDTATQILIHRQDNGQSLTEKSSNIQTNKATMIDDSELKNRIIARYSYVDKDEKKKEFKPVAPKVEPKKLVRYRDNKIVSLKGERYTEIKRDDQEGDLKKPKQKNITQP